MQNTKYYIDKGFTPPQSVMSGLFNDESLRCYAEAQFCLL